MTDTADRLDPRFSLTPPEIARVRKLAEKDSVSLLSAAYATAFAGLDDCDRLIERMLEETKRCAR